jgi:hypothetical protein
MANEFDRYYIKIVTGLWIDPKAWKNEWLQSVK